MDTVESSARFYPQQQCLRQLSKIYCDPPAAEKAWNGLKGLERDTRQKPDGALLNGGMDNGGPPQTN